MDGLITEEQILALTNNQKREDFLKTWPEWPVLVKVPELGLISRQVVLPDGGQQIISLEYGQRGQTIHTESYRHCYFQMRYPKAGISPYNDVGNACEIEALKKLRMEIVSRRKKVKADG